MQNLEISSDQAVNETRRNKAQTVRFNNKQNDTFYSEVTKRVNQYFKDNNLSKHANGEMLFKTIFILVFFTGSYVLLLLNIFPLWGMLLLTMVNGLFTAFIGLNIAHDAIHGSYSNKEWVNKSFAVLFNIIGANDHAWRISHNLVHHTYTNIPDHDSDIDQIPLIRLNPNQDLWKVHRFQHIYTFFFYALTSLSWVFLKDFTNFFFKGADPEKYPKKEVYRLFFYKAIYYTLFLVVPFMVIDLPWYYILIGFVVLHLVEGLTLALIFQLAHIVEGTEFPEPDQEGNLENSWAVHQMYTTADFAKKNFFTNFLFGGLNFQIEHHLFPKICHIHYKNLAPIVEQTAKDFDLPYVEHPTFIGAIQSHVKVLKKLGTVA